MEELAVTPEPLVLQGPTELSGPLASVILHVQDEGNLLGWRARARCCWRCGRTGWT